MKINIKQLIKAIFFVGLFYGLINIFLPSVPVIYLCDMLIVFSLLFMLLKPRTNYQQLKPLWGFVILFFLIGTLSFIWNGGNILHYLWGLRNYFRFFAFFFLCVYYLRKEDGEWCINIIIKSFWVHIAMVAIEFFLGYQQDCLGGIFGISAGSNAGLNIYLVGMVCLLLQNYHNHKVKLTKVMIYFVLMCTNAALSELKFFFVELILIMSVYLLFTKSRWKTIKIVLGVIPIVLVGINVLAYVFPYFKSFFELENIIDQLFNPNASYATAYDVGRSSVFSKLTPIIQNWSSNSNVLWGIGLGNGDYSSSFPLLNGAFYKIYEGIHYVWFSLGHLFVETGYLGTISYLMFFISCLITGLHRYRIKRIDNYLMLCLFSFGCLMIIFYNCSMRNNCAYLAFFLLALPFIQSTQKNISK